MKFLCSVDTFMVYVEASFGWPFALEAKPFSVLEPLPGHFTSSQPFLEAAYHIEADSSFARDCFCSY